ncbi:cardiolipin synthase [Brumimicrobium oceani]|uniref:Cardiolipin synthase n=1 Tax=Brumimicrobium oceani TaxID=2100725 RepID=A0A2U2XBQ0_9FLAO|nr:cardiolipin synthase [Brumimicrobium oceani]PWH85212.1 cardiolipin synthase [Brumimicrobium oceani]
MWIAWWAIQIIYAVIVIAVSIRIIYDTQSSSKTLAYLLFVILVPVLGIIFYLSIGINYRKRKMYSKKLIKDAELSAKLKNQVLEYAKSTYMNSKPLLKDYKKLINMITTDTSSSISDNNRVKLLLNGEKMFPEALESMSNAKHHIHIQFYIFENDIIGNQIVDLLIEKAQEGVEVRFIYDDFGSKAVRGKLHKKMEAGGVKVFPFSKIVFIYLANRMNYRNHRKIIIVDGKEAFVGGINVSDKYINHPEAHQMYWRDTHIQLNGHSVYFLQHTFLCDWNFCANDEVTPSDKYFPPPESFTLNDNKIVQIVASGPDSPTPTILYSLLQAINLAKEEVLITTPYFIPGESMIEAIAVAALGGVKIKLLVPGKSDSKIVSIASRFYFSELLRAGVEIYLYQKGFVHAKTMVVDDRVAIVGTANMDYRSFDLNFEVNAIVYDEETTAELKAAFYQDLQESEKIIPEEWYNRSKRAKLLERTVRLGSPLL